MLTFTRGPRTALLLASAFLAAGLAAHAQRHPAAGLMVAQPQALNITAESTVAFRVPAPLKTALSGRFDLLSEDGQVVVPVFDSAVGPGPAEREASFSITPAQLAPFALGEMVTLRGAVGPWRTEAQLKVTATEARSESRGWVLNVPATAVVYSTRDSEVAFRSVSPKNKPVAAKLLLKFRNIKGNVVAKWKYPIVALPGESVHTVTVPVAVCLKAKLKGAASLKSFLMVGGIQKAAGQSLVDWDLAVSASADQSSGTAPALVTFTTLVSGGAAPYIYAWDFGDGSAPSTSQNPSHVYTSPGIYTAAVAVVDSRGGTVASDPIVIAVN